MFDALPDSVGGLAVSTRLPGPRATVASSDGWDGFVVAYGGTEGSAAVIDIVADPGTGIMSPAHGMASMLVYSGGPQRCIDDDHSPLLDRLFTLRAEDDLQAELRRIVESPAAPDQFVWLVCTETFDGDRNLPRPEGDWRYVAHWSDGGWLYSVRASSAGQRAMAITALTDAVASATAAQGMQSSQ